MESISKRKLMVLLITVCLVLSMVGWIALAEEEPSFDRQSTEKNTEKSVGKVHSREMEPRDPGAKNDTSIPESIPDIPDQNDDLSALAASEGIPEQNPMEETESETPPINEETEEQRG